MIVQRAPVPEGLTHSSIKAQLFSVDPYYRDGWDGLATACGDQTDIVDLTWCSVGVMLRPDALASGRIEVFLDTMAAISLRPVAYRRVEFTRLMIRELWRYQLNIATRQRIRAMDALLVARTGLLVVLLGAPGSVPVCVSLRCVKGPSDPRRRASSNLRALLSDVQVSAVTLVHTPDEPIDWIRDLGLFVDPAELPKLLDEMAAGQDASAGVRREAQALQSVLGPMLPANADEQRLARDLLRRDAFPTQYRTPWPIAVSMAEQAETHVVGREAVIPDVDPEQWAWPPR